MRGGSIPALGAYLLKSLLISFRTQRIFNASEAEPLFEQALELNKKLFGADHPEVANNMNNLADLYELQGRHAEAEIFYKQALEVRKKLFGLGHQEVAVTMNSLASLYSAQGNYAEAGPLYKQALMILERTLGVGHPYTITARRNFNRFQREKAARIVGG